MSVSGLAPRQEKSLATSTGVPPWMAELAQKGPCGWKDVLPPYSLLLPHPASVREGRPELQGRRPKAARVAFPAFSARLSLASRLPGEMVRVVESAFFLFSFKGWRSSRR